MEKFITTTITLAISIVVCSPVVSAKEKKTENYNLNVENTAPITISSSSNNTDFFYQPIVYSWKFACTGYKKSSSKSSIDKGIESLRLNKLGISNWNEGNYTEAIENFTDSLSVSPNILFPLHNRAVAKLYSYDLNGAISDINRAIELSKKGKSKSPPISFVRLRKYLLLKKEGIDLIVPKRFEYKFYQPPPTASELNARKKDD